MLDWWYPFVFVNLLFGFVMTWLLSIDAKAGNITKAGARFFLFFPLWAIVSVPVFFLLAVWFGIFRHYWKEAWDEKAN